MSKIGVFLAEGFEEIEALTVVDICRRAGITVETVAIGADKAVTSSHQVTVKADKLLTEMNFSELSMIVLPGGMPGTKNLEACEPLMTAVKDFAVSGKWLAAICAAPSIFGHKGILQGKRACCYPAFEGELSGAAVSRNRVEVDDRVITSRGMGTAIPFALTIVEQLVSAEKALAVKESVVYETE